MMETTKQLGKRWGITPTRVAQYIRAGAIPSVEKMGRDWVVFNYPDFAKTKAALLALTRTRGDCDVDQKVPDQVE